MDFETNLVSESQQLEPFQMRCPNCRKLYSVEPNLLGANAAEVSKFECVACRTSFLAVMPELHGHHFLETRLLETQLAPLRDEPERAIVDAEIADVATPAERVALVSVPLKKEMRLRELAIEDLEISESAALISLWDSVVADYENLAKHETFLNKCFEEQRLVYATHKYAQILVAAPYEEIARKMRKRAIGLASYGFDTASSNLSPINWKIPLPSFNNFIILLGTIAVMIGVGLPHAKQAAGVGFAMIALALGLRFFLRRPQDT